MILVHAAAVRNINSAAAENQSDKSAIQTAVGK